MSWKTVDISISSSEIIDKIPTSILEEELKDRKELQVADIKQAEREERWRSEDFDIEIDPESYGLIDEEDVTLANFDDSDMIYELITHGYEVFDKDDVYPIKLNNVSKYIQELSSYKFKEFMCDICGLSHLATNEEIINEIKNRL